MSAWLVSSLPGPWATQSNIIVIGAGWGLLALVGPEVCHVASPPCLHNGALINTLGPKAWVNCSGWQYYVCIVMCH